MKKTFKIQEKKLVQKEKYIFRQKETFKFLIGPLRIIVHP